MGEASSTSPFLFLPYLLCLLLMTYPAIRIVGLYVEGGISSTALALMLMSLLALMAGVARTWGTPAGALMLLVFFLLCVGIPGLNALAERRLRQRLLEEDIEKCHRILSFDPKNVHAHSRLGDIYLALGHHDEAIDYYHQATRLAPEDKHEKRKLQRAIERKRRAEVESVFCPRCRTENPGGALYCRECRLPLSPKRELVDFLRAARDTGVLKWTACGCGAILLIDLFTRQVPLPLLVVAGLVLACAVGLQLYFRRSD